MAFSALASLATAGAAGGAAAAGAGGGGPGGGAAAPPAASAGAGVAATGAGAAAASGAAGWEPEQATRTRPNRAPNERAVHDERALRFAMGNVLQGRLAVFSDVRAPIGVRNLAQRSARA